MSDAAEHAALEGEEASQDAPRRRGRPPRNPTEIAMAATNAAAIAEVGFVPAGPEALVVISVKPSEAWKCPYVDDGAGGTRITAPKEQLWVPLSLAKHMERHEQAIILERRD